MVSVYMVTPDTGYHHCWHLDQHCWPHTLIHDTIMASQNTDWLIIYWVKKLVSINSTDLSSITSLGESSWRPTSVWCPRCSWNINHVATVNSFISIILGVERIVVTIVSIAVDNLSSPSTARPDDTVPVINTVHVRGVDLSWATGLACDWLSIYWSWFL